MIMKKNIIKIEHPRKTYMVGDGFRVSQYIPWYGKEMNQSTSPFLMLDYNAPWQIPPQSWHRPGVGFHPHRGFETVTIVYSGEIEHQDTAGNGWVIWADEVQWMTAGSGLLHNEFMTDNFSEKWGIQHAIQLWINLPKEYKMTPPKYQWITRESIPNIPFDWWLVRVIAGNMNIRDSEWNIQNHPGIASTFSPVELYDVRFHNNGILNISIVENYTTILLVTEWKITVNGTETENGDMVYFSPSGKEIIMQSTNNAKILIMAWDPIDEPIYNYGPFVMNTQEEIEQAFLDLREWKMWNPNL